VFASHLGRGPAEARTTISGSVVVVVVEGTLTPAEREQVARDGAARVVAERRAAQAKMRDDMADVVAGTLGRKVLSVIGDHDPLADVAVQVFVTEG